MSIDSAVDAAFGPIARVLSDVISFSVRTGDTDFPLIVPWLVAGAVFFTGYLRAINIRGFGHACAHRPGQRGRQSLKMGHLRRRRHLGGWARSGISGWWSPAFSGWLRSSPSAR